MRDRLEIVPGPGAGRFRLVGELDLATVERAREFLESSLQEGSWLRLDLSGLEFMDSTGIHLLIQLSRRARSLEPVSRVCLEAVSPAVRRVLDVALGRALPEVGLLPEECDPADPP